MGTVTRHTACDIGAFYHTKPQRTTYGGLFSYPEVYLPVEGVRIVQVRFQDDVAVTLVKLAVDALIDLKNSR